MQIDSIFPTCILRDSDLDLAKELLPLCNKYTSATNDTLLNIDNYPSTLGSDDLNPLVNNEIIVRNVLYTIINKYAPILADSMGMDFESIDFKPYGFFSSMHRHAFLRKHMHHHCTFSGSIYLEIEGDVPPLVLHNPKSISVFTNQVNNTTFIHPKAGDIVMWNSWLEHEVPQMTESCIRKAFSFNI
jgi:uncharacterized protein (TIGR02466 family)